MTNAIANFKQDLDLAGFIENMDEFFQVVELPNKYVFISRNLAELDEAYMIGVFHKGSHPTGGDYEGNPRFEGKLVVCQQQFVHILKKVMMEE